jgi:hypothetical protein
LKQRKPRTTNEFMNKFLSFLEPPDLWKGKKWMIVNSNTTHAHTIHCPDEGQIKIFVHLGTKWQITKRAKVRLKPNPIPTGTKWPKQTTEPKRLWLEDCETRTVH